MKIYTKYGDKGHTTLANGQTLSKHDIRIECIGTIDELNSWTALISDEIPDKHQIAFLMQIQKNLFLINSIIALTNTYSSHDLTSLAQETFLTEKEIDIIHEQLPPLSRFIFYGGHPIISHIHITRSICRRAERTLAAIDNVPIEIQTYCNRISDYFFVLARWICMQLKVQEKYWIP